MVDKLSIKITTRNNDLASHTRQEFELSYEASDQIKKLSPKENPIFTKDTFENIDHGDRVLLLQTPKQAKTDTDWILGFAEDSGGVYNTYANGLRFIFDNGKLKIHKLRDDIIDGNLLTNKVFSGKEYYDNGYFTGINEEAAAVIEKLTNLASSDIETIYDSSNPEQRAKLISVLKMIFESFTDSYATELFFDGHGPTGTDVQNTFKTILRNLFIDLGNLIASESSYDKQKELIKQYASLHGIIHEALGGKANKIPGVANFKERIEVWVKALEDQLKESGLPLERQLIEVNTLYKDIKDSLKNSEGRQISTVDYNILNDSEAKMVLQLINNSLKLGLTDTDSYIDIVSTDGKLDSSKATQFIKEAKLKALDGLKAYPQGDSSIALLNSLLKSHGIKDEKLENKDSLKVLRTKGHLEFAIITPEASGYNVRIVKITDDSKLKTFQTSSTVDLKEIKDIAGYAVDLEQSPKTRVELLNFLNTIGLSSDDKAVVLILKRAKESLIEKIIHDIETTSDNRPEDLDTLLKILQSADLNPEHNKTILKLIEDNFLPKAGPVKAIKIFIDAINKYRANQNESTLKELISASVAETDEIKTFINGLPQDPEYLDQASILRLEQLAGAYTQKLETELINQIANSVYILNSTNNNELKEKIKANLLELFEIIQVTNTNTNKLMEGFHKLSSKNYGDSKSSIDEINKAIAFASKTFYDVEIKPLVNAPMSTPSQENIPIKKALVILLGNNGVADNASQDFLRDLINQMRAKIPPSQLQKVQLFNIFNKYGVFSATGLNGSDADTVDKTIKDLYDLISKDNSTTNSIWGFSSIDKKLESAVDIIMDQLPKLSLAQYHDLIKYGRFPKAVKIESLQKYIVEESKKLGLTIGPQLTTEIIRRGLSRKFLGQFTEANKDRESPSITSMLSIFKPQEDKAVRELIDPIDDLLAKIKIISNKEDALRQFYFASILSDSNISSTMKNQILNLNPQSPTYEEDLREIARNCLDLVQKQIPGFVHTDMTGNTSFGSQLYIEQQAIQKLLSSISIEIDDKGNIKKISNHQDLLTVCQISGLAEDEASLIKLLSSASNSGKIYLSKAGEKRVIINENFSKELTNKLNSEIFTTISKSHNGVEIPGFSQEEINQSYQSLISIFGKRNVIHKTNTPVGITEEEVMISLANLIQNLSKEQSEQSMGFINQSRIDNLDAFNTPLTMPSKINENLEVESLALTSISSKGDIVVEAKENKETTNTIDNEVIIDQEPLIKMMELNLFHYVISANREKEKHKKQQQEMFGLSLA